MARPKTSNFVLEGATTQKKKSAFAKRLNGKTEKSLVTMMQDFDRMNSSLMVNKSKKSKKGKKAIPIDQRVDQ